MCQHFLIGEISVLRRDSVFFTKHVMDTDIQAEVVDWPSIPGEGHTAPGAPQIALMAFWECVFTHSEVSSLHVNWLKKYKSNAGAVQIPSLYVCAHRPEK